MGHSNYRGSMLFASTYVLQNKNDRSIYALWSTESRQTSGVQELKLDSPTGKLPKKKKAHLLRHPEAHIGSRQIGI
jgi:hypothetical protein